jgi:hypothetical protein
MNAPAVSYLLFETVYSLREEDWSLLDKSSGVTATIENNPGIIH